MKILLIVAIAITAMIYLNNMNDEAKIFWVMFIVFASTIYYVDSKFTNLTRLIEKKHYRCVFHKRIIGAESDYDILARFEIEAKLSFPPQIGMAVAGYRNSNLSDGSDKDGNDYQEFFTGKISSVYWKHSEFICEVERHKMEPEHILGQIINLYSQDGWIIKYKDEK